MRSYIIILTVILLAVVLNLPSQYRPFYRDLSLKLGLDLSGGVHLVYQADTSALPDSDRAAAVEATRTNIERRVNSLGVSEPIIQTSKVGSDYRLIVELAGITDINQAISLIGQTAQLEFRATQVATPSSAADFTSIGLTGRDLRLAQVQFNGGKIAGQPVVSLEFSSEGAKKFADITSKSIGQPLAIFLDDRLVTAPTVQSVISDGRAVISGNFTPDEAKKLVIQLNAGALPIPIHIIEQRNIGATLGVESIHKSLVAAAVGLVVIWLFMIVNYGLKGFLADLALVVYILIFLALIKLIPITLTLAGIAGFILSIGMAVDANILIFERMKEELRWGRPLKAAVELGFHRAWTSVRDSNASSLITAGLIFWFGTGSVRGFALTLAVGILVSLFTSITVTRTLLRLIYAR
ncbi:MAG: Preprotein translocase subunit SecD [Candidatus Amesbacteria bacterium GW2011_GWB1_47_26]|uniref:Protein translocase subunit SecD n=1 Tax=Candidatus Amesbacteria bacterium GW2011_GWC2_45_19 TaxID=1618366 RepID=A0A0G1Q2V2_9BACT|nr:MAG: Preprotein translocase subunit SecD [Candidatus Amesbacteria bacterium GW2011_GWC2_45_19]KKU69170.1 MAG: Preprotein translocase subunit SecD [Microgenomates group bacterium GW2011_GWC1_47_20]KKU73463.1 MAG: Preprotein translocase subunit SecD [Candidatus Amesbacteria bacterium GW2011_GWB1_47_26]KKU78741.1 MAG: Preprotein translocase subunit SecD [Candidatus Amesbacteria bacterium GW2011_GWA2_47_70]